MGCGITTKEPVSISSKISGVGGGSKVQEGEDSCILIPDSHSCTAAANTL